MDFGGEEAERTNGRFAAANKIQDPKGVDASLVLQVTGRAARVEFFDRSD